MASTKAPDLSNFLDGQEQRLEEEPRRRRRKGTQEVVCITLRLNQQQWRRAHDLSLNEGLSINQLAIEGINELMKKRGLPQL